MSVRLRQYLPAFALAALLGGAWTASDWHNLTRLWLPDTDDVMRLQQVRDWIAGQATGDLTQHRLANGLAMHWSRIPDLVPAALILLLRPLTGMWAAEVTAVIVSPLLQFAGLLALTWSIAQRLAPGSAGTAMLLAALAYPASSLFLPGRIDHHGLQLLLVLVQVRTLLSPSRAMAPAVAGAAIAIGVAVGLETLPFAIVTAGVLTLNWLRGNGKRLQYFGLALATGLLTVIPLAGRGGVCDTIGPLTPIAIVSALALAVISRITHYRLASLVATGCALAFLAWPSAQPCLAGPYASLDPTVARLWLAQVGEAQSLMTAAPEVALTYAGLLVAGLIATMALLRTRDSAWWLVLPYQVLSLAITAAQLRGAYVGAALAVLPFAALISEQRRRSHTSIVMALWITGSGLTYPLLASLVESSAAAARSTLSCSGLEVRDQLALLPTGRVMASMDLGPYALAGTPHRLVAAPYHRNDVGNVAMYRFYLSDVVTAARIARAWHIDYIVVCPGALGSVPSAQRSIERGARPAWMRKVAPSIYVVDAAALRAD